MSKEFGFQQILLSEHAKGILVELDKILQDGFFGDEFTKYSNSWIELHLEEGQADVLQSFHDMVEAML